MIEHSLPVLDCTGCLAPCCKELLIVEVEEDEVNEHMLLDKPVWPVSPEERERREQLGLDPPVYLLRRRKDGACVHLTDDNQGGIYEHRPAA